MLLLSWAFSSLESLLEVSVDSRLASSTTNDSLDRFDRNHYAKGPNNSLTADVITAAPEGPIDACGLQPFQPYHSMMVDCKFDVVSPNFIQKIMLLFCIAI